MTKEISLDQPLLEQAAVREILFPKEKGLISNLMLKRLLKVTRVLVQNQLKQKFPNYELANLVVGYDVFTKDESGEIPEQMPQLFSVDWNNPSLPKGLETQEIDDPSFNEFTSSLFSHLQQVITELLPRFIGNKTVYIYLSLIVIEKQSGSIEILKARALNFRCGKCSGQLKRIINGQCTNQNC
jgi:hypothetical protein